MPGRYDCSYLNVLDNGGSTANLDTGQQNRMRKKREYPKAAQQAKFAASQRSTPNQTPQPNQTSQSSNQNQPSNHTQEQAFTTRTSHNKLAPPSSPQTWPPPHDPTPSTNNLQYADPPSTSSTHSFPTVPSPNHVNPDPPDDQTWTADEWTVWKSQSWHSLESDASWHAGSSWSACN